MPNILYYTPKAMAAKKWCSLLFLILNAAIFPAVETYAKDVNHQHQKQSKFFTETQTRSASHPSPRKLHKTNKPKLNKPKLSRKAKGKKTKRSAYASYAYKSGLQPWNLKAGAAVIVDQDTQQVLYEKNPDAILPIASVTKIMLSLIVLESQQNLGEILEVSNLDRDTIKGTSSRLKTGDRFTRLDYLNLALSASENRAAFTLARNYPGGRKAFVRAMNAKAKAIGMKVTRFADPTGLDKNNVSSAKDLAKLLQFVHENHPLIGEWSTLAEGVVYSQAGRAFPYSNTNYLVRSGIAGIGLQKTGYIRESGRCLIMQVQNKSKSLLMVFLGSPRPKSHFSDAKHAMKLLFKE